MTATGWRLLAGCAAIALAVGYLLGKLAYGDLPALPAYAPLTLGVLAVVELAMARVVRDRVHRRAGSAGRPVHPEQIARAAVLAKASSPTGALLGGLYVGLLMFLLTSSLPAASDDAPVAAISALTAAGLTAAALLLERACRLPQEPDRDGTVGSRT